jgi:hypothetical protein
MTVSVIAYSEVSGPTVERAMSNSGQHPSGAGEPRLRPWQPAPYRRSARLLDQLADVEPDEEPTPERRATALALLGALVMGLAAATALVIFAMVGSIR